MTKSDSGPVVATEYWHRLEDGRIQCDVCPRFCALREGQRGLCFVRARQDDRIVLTTYGRSSGFCVDPIEKKPLDHFLPGTAVLSFGTEGCNLSCRFCQNWDISKSREIAKLADEASPEIIARAAKELGCASVAFTYNDPTIFLEYAIDVAEACHERGIATVAVTAGYICDAPRADFYREIDAANVDLKAFTDKFYREITGAHLQPVLETLLYLKTHTNVWLEITNLVIPGQNDSEEEIAEMTRWIVRTSGPTSRCTSRPFTPTGRCWTSPRPRRRHSPAPAGSRSRPEFVMLHGKRPRHGRGSHVLPRLRGRVDRPRRLRADYVESGSGPVQDLR